MEITIQNATERQINQKKLIDLVIKILESELGDREVGILNIKLTDDKEITRINEQFRGKAEPTDILSFEYGLEEEIIGDIVLSLERIAEQSEEFGYSFEEELSYILIHGILHILGYEHQGDDTGEEEIFAIQKEYFQRYFEEG